MAEDLAAAARASRLAGLGARARTPEPEPAEPEPEPGTEPAPELPEAEPEPETEAEDDALSACWDVQRETPELFLYGEVVLLVGIKSEPELNGTMARVASQPPSVRDKGRVRVTPCGKDGAPLRMHGGWKGLKPANLRLESKPSRGRALGDTPAPLEQPGLHTLDADTLILIMGRLSSASRVTLAAAHPHFRTVLFDAGSLWSAAPLVLELCNGAGYDGCGGWYKRSSCVCCGVSFLDAPVLSCEHCGDVWACQRCFGIETAEDGPPLCCNLRDLWRVANPKTLADMCRLCGKGSRVEGRGLRALNGNGTEIITSELSEEYSNMRPERERHPHDGYSGRVEFLSDRWLCSLPPQYRRTVTATTTHLTLHSCRKGERNERGISETVADFCSSVDVGLGALIHLGETVTWPTLRHLQVAETDDYPGDGSAAGGLYRFTWDHQLKRLARHMPALYSMSYGDYYGLEDSAYSTLASRIDVKTLLKRLPTVRAMNAAVEWLHKISHARLQELECVWISGYTYEKRSLALLLQALPKMTDLVALRITASGKLFPVLETVLRHAPTLQILHISTDTVTLRRLRASDAHILDGHAFHEEQMGDHYAWGGQPPPAPEPHDCAADLTDHFRALREHPTLRHVSISIDSGYLNGYRECDGKILPKQLPYVVSILWSSTNDTKIRILTRD